ncbi:hypothetical protein, partial [Pseudomonas nitroreducens]|uniref:hypothetical protein n=1 Tax=Pseudomonas nitroreducens TaxID=46680 RepID=UPI001F331AA0
EVRVFSWAPSSNEKAEHSSAFLFSAFRYPESKPGVGAVLVRDVQQAGSELLAINRGRSPLLRKKQNLAHLHALNCPRLARN